MKRTTREHNVSAPWKIVKLGAAIGMLALATILVIGVVNAAAGALPGFTPGKAGTGGSPVSGQKGASHCGEPNQPACPTGPNTWVTLTSTAPSAVLLALTSCPDYMSPIAAASNGADTTSSYTFDAPVLVKPASQGNHDQVRNLPHFIIRAAVKGIRFVTYDTVYDPAKQQFRISSIGIQDPKDPHYNKAFPWDGVTDTTALARLQATHGVAQATGRRPELVYFAPNAPTPQALTSWKSGGTDPAEPIWRIQGSDAHLYFIGIDGAVYTASQLPLEPGASVTNA